MDLTLFPLVDSDTTLLDFDESDAPANAPARALAIDIDSGLEVAVEISGNGGSGGGGSSNVVCADMSDDDSGDDNDGSTNHWTRKDAMKSLDIEFWMYHPHRRVGESAHNRNGISVGTDHPQYDLYLQILGLISLYFVRVGSGRETVMIGRIKDGIKNALDAFRAGGYSVDGRHWTELLPTRAEIILTRFVVPYYAFDGSIAAILRISPLCGNIDRQTVSGGGC